MNCLKRGKTPVGKVVSSFSFASDWSWGWREFPRTCQRVKWAKTDALHRTHEITLDGSVGRCIENCSNSNVHNESPGNKNGLDHNRISVYVFVFTTNLQIQVVQCCIHLRIHHMSWSPLLFRSFSDFVVYIETTLIFSTNQRQRASFSINVAIPSLSFKRSYHRV